MAPQNSAGMGPGDRLAQTLPGAIRSRYRIDSELGRGCMGVVMQAHDLRLARAVALKQLYPIRGTGELRHVEARFLREARLAARLVHPNIVTVFDILHEEGQWFLVMELVSGRTMRSILNREHHLPVSLICDWILQIARALECAHEAGVIHRDIKPENLMVQRDGKAKIMDFGVALSVDSPRLTGVGQTMGTPAYLAPEILRGGQPHIGSDLFSLGVVFYELLSGANPFMGGTVMEVLTRIATVRPPALETVCEDLPTGLSAIVARLIAHDPEHRYASATELLVDLEALDLPEAGHPLTMSPSTTLSGARAERLRQTLRERLWSQAVTVAPPVPRSRAGRLAVVFGTAVAISGLILFGYWRLEATAQTYIDSALSRRGDIIMDRQVNIHAEDSVDGVPVPLSPGVSAPPAGALARAARANTRITALVSGRALLPGESPAAVKGTGIDGATGSTLTPESCADLPSAFGQLECLEATLAALPNGIHPSPSVVEHVASLTRRGSVQARARRLANRALTPVQLADIGAVSGIVLGYRVSSPVVPTQVSRSVVIVPAPDGPAGALASVLP